MTLSLAVVAAAPVSAAPAPSAFTIEEHFKVRGPHGVATSPVTDAVTGSVIYQLYYPTDVPDKSKPRYPHPMITFGSGTNASPSDYPGLMNQLASWGFVVVATTDPTEASGAEMIKGIDYMLSQNLDSASVFYGEVDVNNIGALGHSQGAGGAVNAATDDPRVRTTVPVGLPDEKFVKGPPEDHFYVEQIRVPVLFLGGSADKFVASPTTLTDFYNRIYPGVPAGVGTLKGASHSAITRSGGGFLGYVTAWMRFQPANDDLAKGAFVATPPALPEFLVNTNWQNQALKGF